MKITIRKATLGDIPELIRLRRLMFEWMNYSDNDLLKKTEIENEKYLSITISSNRFHGWVAINDKGRIVGSGGLVIDQHPPSPSNLSGKIGYVMNLSVEVEYRKQGIAKEILKQIIIYLKVNGITHASLHATEMGRKLYEKFEFSNTNEMRSNLSNLTIEKITTI